MQGFNMKASELINYMINSIELVGDAEVLIQLDSCCFHAHEIEKVGTGSLRYCGIDTSNELNKIIIRG